MRKPHPPADREQAILEFIATSVRDRGYPPTIREIGEAFGIASTNGVRYYLDRLEQAGRIRRDRWTSRGIELQAIEGGERMAPRGAASRDPATTRPRGAAAAPLASAAGAAAHLAGRAARHATSLGIVG